MLKADLLAEIRRKGATDKWHFYQDKRDKHRWRRTSRNGNIVGSSSEGYRSKRDAVQNAVRHGYRPEDKT